MDHHRGRKRRHQRNRRENLARERMQYDLGFFDHESVRVECAPNSFELKCYPCDRNGHTSPTFASIREKTARSDGVAVRTAVAAVQGSALAADSERSLSKALSSAPARAPTELTPLALQGTRGVRPMGAAMPAPRARPARPQRVRRGPRARGTPGGPARRRPPGPAGHPAEN